MKTTIFLPGSKSIAQRALALQFLHRDRTQLINLPDCSDCREFGNALAKLRSASRGVRMDYDLGNGATSLRFFLAIAASMPGYVSRISCTDQLAARPITPLVEALRMGGAEIKYPLDDNSALMEVRGVRLEGTNISIDSKISSQFASALAMASTLWNKRFELRPDLISVSRPYAEMTLRMMQIFDSSIDSYIIEPDWSAASYFYEFALLNPDRQIFIPNLLPADASLQGDAACATIFERLGVLSHHCEINGRAGMKISADKSKILSIKSQKNPVEIDISQTPDLAPAIAFALCKADISFLMTGAGALIHKESNRILSIAEEAAKAGYSISHSDSHLAYIASQSPGDRKNNVSTHNFPVGSSAPAASFSSHGDHRIAMALGAAGIAGKGMHGAKDVEKSFPDFWARLEECTKKC